MANKIKERLEEECKHDQILCAPLSFVAKDILEEDWSDADIIFTNSLLFSDEMME